MKNSFNTGTDCRTRSRRLECGQPTNGGITSCKLFLRMSEADANESGANSKACMSSISKSLRPNLVAWKGYVERKQPKDPPTLM